MRIAIVHSYYADEALSGENVCVDEQTRMLRDRGHEVLLESRHTNAERRSPLYAARAATRVATGRGGSPSERLAAFQPDIVHVHNLFPNFGTAWLADWPGPLVATVHNYRYGCANGLLLRDGHACLDCLEGTSLSAMAHACYRGSRVATLPLAIATRHGFAGAPVMRRADRLVAVAGHSRDLLVRFGVPAERIDVVPHGIVPRFADAQPGPAERRYLATARLSPEKGIDRLFALWPSGVPLDVVGDGPQADVLRAQAPAGVRLLGARDTTWRDSAAEYTALVSPGVAIEAFPRVVIEAWEAGLPVVAFDGGGVAAAVRGTGAGRTYHDAASLVGALRDVDATGFRLRGRARAAYEATHTPEAWVAAIEATYARAIAARPVRAGRQGRG